MPRPKKCRRICALPRCSSFGPLEGAADGRVEMEVQGDEKSIGDMIDQVGSGWSVHIDNMEIRDLPLEDEREFRVRY